MEGSEAIQQYWSTGLSVGLSGLSLRVAATESLGAHLFEAGRYALVVTDEAGAVRTEHGTYLVLHRLAPDGTWRRAVDVFDRDEPQEAHPPAQGGTP